MPHHAGLMNMNKTGKIGLVRKFAIGIHKIGTSTLKSSAQLTIILLIVLGYLLSINSNCSGQKEIRSSKRHLKIRLVKKFILVRSFLDLF